LSPVFITTDRSALISHRDLLADRRHVGSSMSVDLARHLEGDRPHHDRHGHEEDDEQHQARRR
jgi:hypothetical protein